MADGPDYAKELDDELRELLDASPEEITLHLARNGISPEDMKAMWRRSCEKWAASPNEMAAQFGREELERLNKEASGG